MMILWDLSFMDSPRIVALYCSKCSILDVLVLDCVTVSTTVMLCNNGTEGGRDRDTNNIYIVVLATAYLNGELCYVDVCRLAFPLLLMCWGSESFRPLYAISGGARTFLKRLEKES